MHGLCANVAGTDGGCAPSCGGKAEDCGTGYTLDDRCTGSFSCVAYAEETGVGKTGGVVYDSADAPPLAVCVGA